MQTLPEICRQKLVELGFDSETYRKRLEDDLWQIAAQGEEEYFLDLYRRGVKYQNENNLFVAKLLGICDDFDPNQETAFVMGEFPDIDIDFLPDLRDYLKNEWAPATYGRERVCNIINYSTFGLKMSILDIAKIYGFPRDQINPMTKPLGKDEEGNQLNVDSAKEIFPELAEWLDQNPEVEDSIRRIVGRSKSKGKHAGGLVISSIDLSDFVPLTIDSEGNPTAAWPEGQTSQDLQPVGLVKLDVLGLKDLERVNRICEMVRKDLGIKFLKAKPGSDEEWSDSSYLNDPAALALANAGDTTGIFQFESSGMREMLRNGGVTTFEDLAVYSAMYRPGPMGAGMHTAYCERKQGRQEWSIPEILKPIIESTYGVLAFQEQIMKLLNLVGDIPLVQCEAIRKAISKKKADVFEPAQIQFMTNGLKKPGMTKELLEKLWQEITYFAGYGFNRSITEGTLIPTPDGVKEIQDFANGDLVYSIDESGNRTETAVVECHDHGILDGYEVTFDDGYRIICSENHKFLTEFGQLPIGEIWKSGVSVLSYDAAENNGITSLKVHPQAGYAAISDTRNLVPRKVVRYRPVGERRMYDLEVDIPTHNFVLPSGVVTSNSHSVGYSFISAQLLYLKAHYPVAFYTVSLQMKTEDADIAGLIVEARSKGIEVHPPDFNKSSETFSVVDGKIYAGFSNIKGIGYDVAKRIVDNRPYDSYEDFLEKFGTDAVVHRAFGALGLLDHWGDPIKVYDFCLSYKTHSDRNKTAEKGRQKTTQGQLDKIFELLPEGSPLADAEVLRNLPYDDVKTHVEGLEHAKKLTTIIRRFIKGQKKYADEPLTTLPTLAAHEPDGNLTEDDLILFGSRRSAEQKYFGYYWRSPMNDIPDLKGWTFQSGFSPKDGYRYVECLVVKKPTQRPTKKGGFYYQVEVEDVIGCRQTIIFWEEDYKKFSHALEYWDGIAGHGNALKVFVAEPGNFNNYTFYSQPRWKKVAEFNPDYRQGFDYRLEVLSRAKDHFHE